MWNITQHRDIKTTREIEIIILLKELSQLDYITYSEQFENHFKNKLKKIKGAEMYYRLTYRNEKSVEIWKTDIKGDFVEKIWTLTHASS